ncbi:MAG: hypothetical protein HRT44_11420 [Bdellovibrionales bacterium]|nr:hypothetical protein [Bdellovibrionales bacterium]NQZ19851.1 hypothetical protein [Bdellovibrionales bacterium]
MKKIFLVLMLVCSFDFALALGGYAGVGLGYSQINNDNVSSSIDGGSFSGVTKIGFSFSKNFSLGLALTSWVGSASSLGVDTTTVIYPLAVEGNWHIIQDSNGPYIGLAAATVLDVTIVDSGGTNSTNTSSNSGLGGQLGWNFANGSK